jgi:hypothetical protein
MTAAESPVVEDMEVAAPADEKVMLVWVLLDPVCFWTFY